LTKFNILKLYCQELLILEGVIEINFCPKTHGLGARSQFIVKNLRNKIRAQYLPLKLTIFNILKLNPLELLILRGVVEINFCSKTNG